MIEAAKLEADIYPAGPRGLSAYEIYKKEGGQLSEEEWLKSLNGLTPTIGENGNWFLGTVDTGLPSRGPKGDTGSIKFIVVTELPTENIDETAIYMKPVERPTGENKFEELIYVNGKWEDLGTPNVAVDLSNYYTKEESDEKLLAKQDKLLAGNNIEISDDNVISALTGSDYPIYRMIARWDNLSTSGGSISTITTDETIVNILNNFLTNVANQDNQIGTLTLMSVPSKFDSFSINYIGISNIIQFNQTLKSFKLCLNICCFGAESRYEFRRKGAFHILSGNGKWENNSFSITSLSLTRSAGDGTGNILFTSATENKVEREYLKKTNTSSYTPTGDYNPSTKLYTDKTHYEKMTGYDATKTQVLKNINGTLTWVDEV